MTKQTIEFLHSIPARFLRRRRIEGYARFGETTPTVVLHVETITGFVELDCDNEEHAERLTDTWIRDFGHISARYYDVDETGKLINASPISDYRCYTDDDDCEDGYAVAC